MKNKKINQAKIRWEALRKSLSKKSNPFAGMTKEQVINKLRMTRERLWEEKLAHRP